MSKKNPQPEFMNRPLFLESYWKRPPNKNKGEESNSKIHQAVGYALTSWEMMEEELASLYVRLAEVPSNSKNTAVRRAYGAIESSTGRRKAIEAAAEAFFRQHWEDREIRRAFLRLTEAVSNAAQRRDDIAHGIALSHTINDVRYGCFLFPPEYNTPRTNIKIDKSTGDPMWLLPSKYRFVSAQIVEFADKFSELRRVVQEYAGLMRHLDDKGILFVRVVRGLTIFDGAV